MAFDVGSIEVHVRADWDGRDLKTAEKQLGSVQGGFVATEKAGSRLGSRLKSGLSTGAKYATAALGAGLVVSLKDAVSEAREAEKAGSQTNAVLKSTGATAWTSKKQIEGLAGSISNKTAIDDEQIQSGENMLLTFKNIQNAAGEGNDVFSQTTQIMTDMSVAMGQDTKASAIQLGKALNDPIKGMSALSRVGITFSEDQVKMITKMQESGDLLGAQKMVLKELKSEFAGSAKAAADPMQRLGVVWNNFLEDVGTKAMPFLNKAVDALSKFITEFQKGEGAGGQFRDLLGNVAATLKNLWPVIKTTGTIVATIAKAFAALPAPVQQVLLTLGGAAMVASKVGLLGKAVSGFFTLMRLAPAAMGPWGLAIAAVAAAAILIIKNWDKVKAFLGKVWGWIKGAAKAVGSFVADAARKGFLGPVPLIIANWGKVKAFLGKIWDWIKGAAKDVAGFVSGAFNKLKGALDKVWEGVKGAVRSAWNWIKNSASDAFWWWHGKVQDMVDWVKSLPGKIGAALSGLGGIIMKPFKWAVDKVKGLLDDVIGFFKGAIDDIKGTVDDVTGFLNPFGGGGPNIPTPFASGGPINEPTVALMGEDGSERVVPTNGKHRKDGIKQWLLAGKDLGLIRPFAKGGKLQSKADRAQSRFDLMERAAGISGGATSAAEFNKLMKQQRLIERLLKLQVKASKGAARVSAQEALRSEQLDRKEMQASRRDEIRSRRAERRDKAAERAGKTRFDFGIGGLQTDLSVAEGGYGGDAGAIREKLKAKLEKKLAALQKRLAKPGNSRDKIEALRAAIEATMGQLSGMGAGSTSIVEQTATAAALRGGLFASLGGNAGQITPGKALASQGGTTVVLQGEVHLDDRDPLGGARKLAQQIAQQA